MTLCFMKAEEMYKFCIIEIRYTSSSKKKKTASRLLELNLICLLLYKSLERKRDVVGKPFRFKLQGFYTLVSHISFCMYRSKVFCMKTQYLRIFVIKKKYYAY